MTAEMVTLLHPDPSNARRAALAGGQSPFAIVLTYYL